MDNKLVAATALAGSLAMASFVWGTAQATPAPSAIHAPGNGITLSATKAVAVVAAGAEEEEVVVAAAVVAVAVPAAAAAVVSMSAVAVAVPAAAAVAAASRDPAEAAEVRA